MSFLILGDIEKATEIWNKISSIMEENNISKEELSEALNKWAPDTMRWDDD